MFRRGGAWKVAMDDVPGWVMRANGVLPLLGVHFGYRLAWMPPNKTVHISSIMTLISGSERWGPSGLQILPGDTWQFTDLSVSAIMASRAARFETFGAIFGTSNRLLDVGGGARVMGYATNTVVRISNGTNCDTTIGGSGTIASLVKSAFGYDTTSFTAVANGGSKTPISQAFGAIVAPIYFGNSLAGNRALNGTAISMYVGAIKGMYDGTV